MTMIIMMMNDVPAKQQLLFFCIKFFKKLNYQDGGMPISICLHQSEGKILPSGQRSYIPASVIEVT